MNDWRSWHPFRVTMTKEDAFVRGYLEAALWTSLDENDHPLDVDFNIGDFSDEAVDDAIKDISKFYTENEGDLAETTAHDSQHGHDFWLSRNGHGAGFFDRGYGEVGDRLQSAAEEFGELSVFVGDDEMLVFA